MNPDYAAFGPEYVCHKADNSWREPSQAINTSAHATLAGMFNVAKTGITAENGWNNFWSVDATNDTLKFGDLVVYQAE